jgi:hypothetical protein
LPSSHDAVTVMASQATAVVIASVRHVQKVNLVTSVTFVSRRVLQGNENANVYPVPLDGFTLYNQTYPYAKGMTYLIFMSFNRGGSCPAAVYSYNSESQVASLIDERYSVDRDLILLPGKRLPVPKTMTLGYVRAHMYPTGGVVVPSDEAEWNCPGP